MTDMMKAVAAFGNGQAGLVEIPIPEPDDYSCLTKILYCGLCNGTDTKLLHDRVANKKIIYPTILGHESVGIIVRIGKKVRNWKVGDRVVSPIGTIAPASGYTSSFGQMAEYGITHDIRAMMEDGIDLKGQPPVPDYRGKLIPDGMSYRDAVMLLTFKENYSALKNFGLSAGDRLLICGDGPVAMGIASIARYLGAAEIVVIGHHDERLEHIGRYVDIDMLINSKKTDALEKLSGRNYDMLIDAVGNMDTVRSLSVLLRQRAVIGLYGVLTKQMADINLFDFPNNVSLHMLNWPYGEHRAHEEVCELVEKGVLVPSRYYSHVIPMEEVENGFKMIENREAFKVILKMPGTVDN